MLNLRMRKTATLVVLALAMICFCSISAGSAFAQAVSGDLTGTVTDASGAAIPNATVTAVNTDTNFTTTTTTGSAGQYIFKNLATGTYNLTATAKGYKDGSVKNYTLVLNMVGTVNMKLNVGSGAPTVVDVSETGVHVDTASPQIQNTADNQMASELPTASVGLGILNASLLGAGVASSGGVGAGTGPSVGGQRPRNNNFTIEGVDVNSKSVTGPLLTVPNDAVQDFTLLQNQFSAEYGHSSGGQFNTSVLSGSNRFHGRAYEYFQNRNLNAIDTLNSPSLTGVFPATKTRYDNNRFGGQVGGPIIHNKLFFFTNWEYQPIGVAGGSAGVCAPTSAGYTALGGIAGLSANNLSVLKTYLPASSGQSASCGTNNGSATAGTTRVNGVDIPIGQEAFFGPSFSNTLDTTNSGDWNISAKDQLRVRYLYAKNVGSDTAANLPAFWLTLPTKYHVFTLNEYHTFSVNVNNEVRLGFNRYANNTLVPATTFPGLTVFPNLTMFDLGVNIGPNPNGPQGTIQNTYQAVDNVSWHKGKHDLKFGVEYREYISPQYFTQRLRGDYYWNNLQGYLTDIAPDNFGERSTGNFPYYGNQRAFYWYAQDQWRFTSRLTINLGVRYEYTGVPTGENAQSLNAIANAPSVGLIFGNPTAQKNNYVPRIGFAWDPKGDGKTSVRGGFSMAYDVLYDNLGILSRPPEFSSTCDVNLGGPPPATCPYRGFPGDTQGFLAGGGLPFSNGVHTFATQASAAASTASFIPNQVLPYSESWNLGVQHEFGGKYTVEVRYVGSKGIHLPVQTRLNTQSKTTSTLFLPTFLAPQTQAQIDALGATNYALINANSNYVPAYVAAGFNSARVVAFEPWGQSIYHGLSTQLDRRFSNGMQFRLAWTWSHLRDNSTADVFSTVLTPRRPQDFQCWKCDMSDSALDRRQRITAQFIYELPFYKHSSNYIAKTALAGWILTPIYTYQAPESATVESNIDVNGNGDAAGDRAIFNPAGIPGTGSGVIPLCTSSLPAGTACGSSASRPFLVAYLATNPNAQYIVGGTFAKTNTSRNTLGMRRIDNIDLTVSKKFNVREGMYLEFQAQALNLLNHPQYIPGSVDGINSIGYTGGSVTTMLTPGKVAIPSGGNNITPTATDIAASSNSKFNQPNITFSSNPRAMQLVLKFVF